jgi:translation initiation factor 2B subunit (eIF-2B alpha/beta/delta family)
MEDEVEKTVRDIENVEIQGATNVAEAGVCLLRRLAEEGAEDERIDEVARRLKNARPTEPFLFNCVRVARETGEYERVLRQIEKQEAIDENGAPLVGEDDVVYTHCHSSSVTSVLHKVAEEREFRARVTETRPLYQGRETARELAEMGVPVRFYVDSGARIALREADVMMIGADAVLNNGKVINKIGSEMFSEIAGGYDVPVYVVTNSWKYDPMSSFGYETEIEKRAAEEVWKQPPEGVDVVNYAFERIAPKKVEGVVSELGVHEPNEFVGAVSDEYPELEETAMNERD